MKLRARPPYGTTILSIYRACDFKFTLSLSFLLQSLLLGFLYYFLSKERPWLLQMKKKTSRNFVLLLISGAKSEQYLTASHRNLIYIRQIVYHRKSIEFIFCMCNRFLWLLLFLSGLIVFNLICENKWFLLNLYFLLNLFYWFYSSIDFILLLNIFLYGICSYIEHILLCNMFLYWIYSMEYAPLLNIFFYRIYSIEFIRSIVFTPSIQFVHSIESICPFYWIYLLVSNLIIFILIFVFLLFHYIISILIILTPRFVLS